jgi:hypothetical protein
MFTALKANSRESVFERKSSHLAFDGFTVVDSCVPK